MAVRQYVGARYVPKFADPVAWQNGTSYEAFTIVTYNNSSYTSKIPVPATVGNPADNSEYWALTGNYNAQVEAYREETVAIQEKLSEEIANRENSDTEANSNLANPFGDVLVIGDSYAYHNDIENIFKTTYPSKYNVYWSGISGSGFVGNEGVTNYLTSFNTLISTVTNKNAIRHTFIVGNYNDANALADNRTTMTDLYNAIVELTEAIYTNLPNTDVHYIMPAINQLDTGTDVRTRFAVMDRLTEFSYKHPISIHDIRYLFNNIYFAEDNKFHLNSYGTRVLVNYMIGCISGNVPPVPVHYNAISLTSDVSNISLPTYYEQTSLPYLLDPTRNNTLRFPYSEYSDNMVVFKFNQLGKFPPNDMTIFTPVLVGETGGATLVLTGTIKFSTSGEVTLYIIFPPSDTSSLTNIVIRMPILVY